MFRPSKEAAIAVTDKFFEQPYDAKKLTAADWDNVAGYIWEQLPSHSDRRILHVFQAMDRQFVTGERCPVCGNTAEQSKAIDYDCETEC